MAPRVHQRCWRPRWARRSAVVACDPATYLDGATAWRAAMAPRVHQHKSSPTARTRGSANGSLIKPRDPWWPAHARPRQSIILVNKSSPTARTRGSANGSLIKPRDPWWPAHARPRQSDHPCRRRRKRCREPGACTFRRGPGSPAAEEGPRLNGAPDHPCRRRRKRCREPGACTFRRGPGSPAAEEGPRRWCSRRPDRPPWCPARPRPTRYGTPGTLTSTHPRRLAGRWCSRRPDRPPWCPARPRPTRYGTPGTLTSTHRIQCRFRKPGKLQHPDPETSGSTTIGLETSATTKWKHRSIQCRFRKPGKLQHPDPETSGSTTIGLETSATTKHPRTGRTATPDTANRRDIDPSTLLSTGKEVVAPQQHEQHPRTGRTATPDTANRRDIDPSTLLSTGKEVVAQVAAAPDVGQAWARPRMGR